MGDFNLEPSSPLYDRIVGPLSPEYGRLNAIEGFVDAWWPRGTGSVKASPAPRRTATTINESTTASSAPRSLLPRLRACWIDDDAPGSDHHPIWTELDL